MSSFVIALLFAIGGGGWIYAKTNRTTGGNIQTALTMGAAAGVTILIIALILLSFIPE